MAHTCLQNGVSYTVYPIGVNIERILVKCSMIHDDTSALAIIEVSYHVEKTDKVNGFGNLETRMPHSLLQSNILEYSFTLHVTLVAIAFSKSSTLPLLFLFGFELLLNSQSSLFLKLLAI